MSASPASRNRASNSALGTRLWMGFFVLLAAVFYSPWVAPYGRHEPFILGLPYTLFWWMALTLLLLVSIILFVVFWWKEEGEEGTTE